MFLGTHTHSLDDKGRVTIPARFREKIADGCVITRGYEQCLVLYTQEDFSQIYHKAQRLTPTDPETRALLRLMFAGASEAELDKAGRINIPPFLRSYARLDGEVVLVGAGQYVEIWNRANWEEQRAADTNTDANVARFVNLDLSVGSDSD